MRVRQRYSRARARRNPPPASPIGQRRVTRAAGRPWRIPRLRPRANPPYDPGEELTSDPYDGGVVALCLWYRTLCRTFRSAETGNKNTSAAPIKYPISTQAIRTKLFPTAIQAPVSMMPIAAAKDSKRDQGKYDKNAKICPAKDAKEAIEGRQEQHTGGNLRRSYPGSSNHVYSFFLSPHYLSADGITASAWNSRTSVRRLSAAICCRSLVNRKLTSLGYRRPHHGVPAFVPRRGTGS